MCYIPNTSAQVGCTQGAWLKWFSFALQHTPLNRMHEASRMQEQWHKVMVEIVFNHVPIRTSHPTQRSVAMQTDTISTMHLTYPTRTTQRGVAMQTGPIANHTPHVPTRTTQRGVAMQTGPIA